METHLRELMAHMEWANGVFFHAWGKFPARDNEEMRRRMDHVVGTMAAFLAVLRGEPVQYSSEGPPPSYEQLRDRARTVHRALRDYAGGLEGPALARRVRIPWFPDPPCEITAAEALVQVAMHTQHHRGQLMTRLKDLGGEPKNVDWILWLWRNRPEARWG